LMAWWSTNHPNYSLTFIYSAYGFSHTPCAISLVQTWGTESNLALLHNPKSPLADLACANQKLNVSLLLSFQSPTLLMNALVVFSCSPLVKSHFWVLVWITPDFSIWMWFDEDLVSTKVNWS
jgi:hypothetical protein